MPAKRTEIGKENYISYLEIMSVGIVIITYNNEGHIHDAISSVVKQNYNDWTCVMIDNGSTDATFSLMEKYCKEDSRFTAYKKSNEGPAAGRNLGYSKLPEDIDYIHFLDGDDMIKPDYISTMVNYLNTHPGVGLVACQFDEIDNNGNYLGKGHRSRYAPSKHGFPIDLPLNIIETPFVAFFSSTAVGPFGVYRKSVFEKTNGYELASQEDTDMFCKMSLLSDVHYLPEYLYIKRVTGTNLAHQKSYQATHVKFRKKWDFYKGKNHSENKLIEESIYYYYTRHVPLRDFKISRQAFMEFLETRSIGILKWSFVCLRNGVKEILFKKSYHRVMKKRKDQNFQVNS